MRSFLMYALVSAFIFVGCSEKELDDEYDKAVLSKDSESFIIKDGVFVFKDWNSFENTIEMFSNMSYTQYQQWVSDNNIQTLLGAFNEICIANDNFDNQVITGELQLEADMFFSDVYYHYLEQGIIKEKHDYEANEVDFDLATSTPYWASVLNFDGKFIVGDSLFLIKEDRVTIYPFTSQGQLKSCMLKDYSEIEALESWVLADESEPLLKSGGFGGHNGPINITSKWVYTGGGGLRAAVDVKFQKWVLNSGRQWNYIHYIQGSTQKKRGILGWRDAAYSMTLHGNWSGMFTYTNYSGGMYNYDFSNSFSTSPMTSYRVWSNRNVFTGQGIAFGINNREATTGFTYGSYTILDFRISQANYRNETFVTAVASY